MGSAIVATSKYQRKIARAFSANTEVMAQCGIHGDRRVWETGKCLTGAGGETVLHAKLCVEAVVCNPRHLQVGTNLTSCEHTHTHTHTHTTLEMQKNDSAFRQMPHS